MSPLLSIATTIIPGSRLGGAFSPPVNTVAPAISGTSTVGQVLTCSDGTWSGSPGIVTTFQWTRNGVNISGANSYQYVLVQADAGTTVSCTVTATNTVGSASISASGVSVLDADAAAYITSISAAGATVSGTQRAAINTFVTAEKAAARWNSLKRVYLPVWGVAAANAIDMVTRTSGTWVNSPTMGAGFVQGNGTNQYFNTGMQTTGNLQVGNSMLFALARGGIGNTALGVGAAANLTIATLDAGYQCVYFNLAGSASLNTGGIYVVAASTTQQTVTRRNQAGFSTLVDVGGSSSGGATANANLFALARNNAYPAGTSPTLYSTTQYGAFGASLRAGIAGQEAFTLNLKTLWETVTGLTLP